MHVPIMGFRKFFPIYLFINGIFRCDSWEGQIIDDSNFIDDFPTLVGAELVG